MDTAWPLTGFVLSLLFNGKSRSALPIMSLIMTTVCVGRRVSKSRVKVVYSSYLLKQI